jgi:lysophospholipase L1-like esterase
MKTFLALGDSYTIGEQVLPKENFPNQTALLLKDTIATPKIIAATGWTTDELNASIIEADISTQYDIVSLLIGVNNQYRVRSIENFEMELEKLLQRAIHFANNKPHHVFVLSIPDWGVTPFAEGRNRQQIAREIDAYNEVCKTTAEKMECHYIDITASQREDGNKAEFLAADRLHPSAKEYAKWAVQLADAITMQIF